MRVNTLKATGVSQGDGLPSNPSLNKRSVTVMCGALRFRGEVLAQVNKAVDVEAGRVKKTGPLVMTITGSTDFNLFKFRCPALMSISRSTFLDCVC